MSVKNYNKQLRKRQRITAKTLIVGLDIGKDFNASALLKQGGEIIGKYERIYNSRKGFEYFRSEIERIKKENGLEEVLIGLEATGHYWRKISYFSKEQGYEVRFIRTTALKHQRELDDSSSAKSDIRDAITIGNIVREGKYIDTIIEEGKFRELRMLGQLRERIQNQNTGASNRLRVILDDYFPELTKEFKSMKAKGLWGILEKCPFPEDILKKRKEELVDIIVKKSRRKKEAYEKAERIYKLAEESIGLKYIGRADKYRLEKTLRELKTTEIEKKETEREMEEILKEVEEAKILLSIPGIGVVTASIFLGELGNIRNFGGAKQIIKYAGYDPQEKDSGQKVGRKFISRKGRWLLRKILFFMGLRAINNIDYLKKYYEKKIQEKNIYGRLLSKKEAICAVIIKLIKMIYSLLRDKREFSIRRPVLSIV